MKEGNKQLYIRGMVLDPETEMPVILLQEPEDKAVLPLWIGPFEASAIIIQMEGVQPPRPLTHDLMAQIMDTHGLKIRKLVIHSILDSKYQAYISYRKGLRRHKIDLRPSDGLALALRHDAPIFVSQEVAQQMIPSEQFFHQPNMAKGEFLFLNSAETPRGRDPLH